MTPDYWLYLFLFFVSFGFILDKTLDYVNTKNWKDDIPPEMIDYYDQNKYNKSRQYHKEKGKISFIQSLMSFIIIIALLIFGLFGKLDAFVSNYSEDNFIIAAFFFGTLFIISDLINISFSLYNTFVIEEKYGFNKTTLNTFILDKIKSYALLLILGGGLLWGAIYVVEYFINGYWIWLWIGFTAFMLLMNMFYADLILPLFNKLIPLEKGELRNEIEKYATKVGYSLKNIYVINGSKRSTKANAFFSGLGPRKTIALYDTLIEKHTIEELVAVLAHEIGHFKKKHILTSLILSIFQTGIILYLLEYFLSYPSITQALGTSTHSFHVGIIAFGLIFSPLATLIGIVMNMLSRKNEFEADQYAKQTYNGKALLVALKKLSVDSLSNLYPHKAYVFVHYSHPPLLTRLERLN